MGKVAQESVLQHALERGHDEAGEYDTNDGNGQMRRVTRHFAAEALVCGMEVVPDILA